MPWLHWVSPQQSSIQVSLNGQRSKVQAPGQVVPFSTLLKYLNVNPSISFESDAWLCLILLAIHGEEEFVAKCLSAWHIKDSSSAYLTRGSYAGYRDLRYGEAVQDFLSGHDKRALEEFRDVVRMENDYSDSHKDSDIPISNSQTYAQQLKDEGSQSMQWIDPVRMRSLPPREQAVLLVQQLRFVGTIKDRGAGPYFFDSKTISRLKELDAVAVPALLDALDKDSTKTRQAPFLISGPNRIFEPYSVSRVSERILAELAFLPNDISLSHERFRQYWQERLGLSKAERIYRCFLEGGQFSDLSSASAALFPARSGFSLSNTYHFESGVMPLPGIKAQLSQKKPSISQLLFKHVNSYQTYKSRLRTYGNPASRSLLNLALASFNWDRDESIGTLNAACGKYLISVQLNGPDDGQTTEDFLRVLDCRKALGDQSYREDLNQFCNILFSSPPSEGIESIYPLIDRASESLYASQVEKLLFSSSSEFNLRKALLKRPFQLEILGSKLLMLEKGRSFVHELLTDQSPIDTEKYVERFGMKWVIDEDGTYRTVPLRSFKSLRTCDIVAEALSSVSSRPAFDLSWPVKRRDRSLPSISRFVDGLGTKLHKINIKLLP